jgi:hypothetical protein
MIGRLSLLVLAMVAVSPPALAQASLLQGAWVEEGTECASVFASTAQAVDFRRPAVAFAPALLITGTRLKTPLASCRIAAVKANGVRQVLTLRCTTTVSSASAQAVLAPAEDGGLYRYSAAEGGIATKYHRCTREMLRAP